MAMFKWSGFYINPADVSAILTGTDPKQGNAHYMVVCLRNGKEFRTNYERAAARDVDADRLASLVSRLQPDPVSRNELEDLLDKVKGAIRRDIKALRDEIVKGPGV